MDKQQMRKTRRMLIYLHNIFNGSQAKIFNELAEHKIDCSDEIVNSYLKEHHILLKDYITILDGNKVAREFINDLNAIIFVKKK